MNPWAEMDSIIKRIPEPKGFGWFTKSELMNHYKMSESCASRTIRKMLNDKLLDEWSGTLLVGKFGKKWRLKPENKGK